MTHFLPPMGRAPGKLPPPPRGPHEFAGGNPPPPIPIGVSSSSESTPPTPPPGGDPDYLAKELAKARNISLEEAREELRRTYGDPKQPDTTTASITTVTSSASATTVSSGTTSVSSAATVDYALASSDAKKSQKYADLETKIENKFSKKGKINPSQNALFDNSYRIVHKWIKSYRKEHNCSLEEAEAAFCQRFNCELQKDSFGYAFVKK